MQLNTAVDAPIQNIYICKVESVYGTLRNVPIKTYPAVQPWGTLPYQVLGGRVRQPTRRRADAVITRRGWRPAREGRRTMKRNPHYARRSGALR